MSVGEHHLSISYNNKTHRQLIIDVINDETNFLSIFKPFGPGLQRAIVGLPTEFYVDLSQQKLTNPTINHSHLQFCLEPSYHAEIDYEQQMATVRYTPLTEGDCPIHIIEYNKDIPNSPFIADIKRARFSTNKPCIRIKGLSEQIIIHRPVEFEVRDMIAYHLMLLLLMTSAIFLFYRFLLIIHLMIRISRFMSKF